MQTWFLLLPELFCDWTSNFGFSPDTTNTDTSIGKHHNNDCNLLTRHYLYTMPDPEPSSGDISPPSLLGTTSTNLIMNDKSIIPATTSSTDDGGAITTAYKPRVRAGTNHLMSDMPVKPLSYGMNRKNPALPSNFCTNGPMDCHCGLPSFWDNNICCDGEGGCGMWFHFGCVRLSSDQVRRIKEFICGRCEDFSAARTTLKTGEELEWEGRVEREERKRKLVVKKKPMSPGKRQKVGRRGLMSEALVVEDEDEEEGFGTMVEVGDRGEMFVDSRASDAKP